MPKLAYESDIEAILAKRHDNGADFWASPDGRIYVGNPFSTISSLAILYELGLRDSHGAVQGGLKLIHDACRDDGRVRVAPKAPMYPCYTAEAVRVLCRFGWKTNNAVKRSVRYFIESVHDSGGWRCDFSKFGRGPETAYANPGATLYVLDVLRWFPKYRKPNETVDGAVEFLLNHWESRKPIGPCQWGIGKQFMQVEFPFLRYNLFYYVYVLSFFQVAKKDKRFKVAVEILKSKLDDKGQLVVEKPHRLLQRLEFCAKGQPSKIATSRYREIQKNLSK